jgi:uncharacterized membrane protein YebE (DUF533 family)
VWQVDCQELLDQLLIQHRNGQSTLRHPSAKVSDAQEMASCGLGAVTAIGEMRSKGI